MNLSEQNRSQQLQPFYTAKAHVFQIDPQTKRNWLPTSKSAVNVCFVHDLASQTYRIIGVEGSKAIINSTVTPNMSFTKTSQKFGQWSDIRANTVYGLGFNSEADLNNFIEKFEEAKKITVAALSSQKSYQNGCINNQTSSNKISSRLVGGADADSTEPQHDTNSISGSISLQSGDVNYTKPSLVAHQRSQSLSGLQVNRLLVDSPKNSKEAKEKLTGSSVLFSQSPTEAQLRYENDRLKLALAQSSANAKKWEIELQTLKNNNTRLTGALQESTSNVKEWKRQLQSLRDENTKMKTKIIELEATLGNPEALEELSKEMNNLRINAASLDAAAKQKDEEIELLKKSLEQHVQVFGASQKVEDRLKMLLAENESLRNQISRLQDGDSPKIMDKARKGIIDQISLKLDHNIDELKTIRDELSTLLTTS